MGTRESSCPYRSGQKQTERQTPPHLFTDKTVPRLWHNCASAVAQVCQRCGKKMAKNTGSLSVQEEAAVVLNFVISRSF